MNVAIQRVARDGETHKKRQQQNVNMMKLLVLAIVVVAVTSQHMACTKDADCNTHCQHLYEVPKCVHHGHHSTCHCEPAECQFPTYLQADWFYMHNGKSISMLIDDRHWAGFLCVEKYDWNKPVIGTIGANHTFLIAEPDGLNTQCYKCVDVLWRTPNVLQIKLGNCLTKTNEMSVNTSCNSIRYKRLPSVDEVITLFKTSHQTNVNCITTLEGFYQFTYEEDYRGGGICNNTDSQIRAFFDPATQYIDNQVFMMRYAKCKNVVSSRNMQIRYQCYGTWYAVRGTIGYTYAAVSDTIERDPRERFKCLMTLRNQTDAQNKIHWVMSRFADCSNLYSIYMGPVRLVLTRNHLECSHDDECQNFPCQLYRNATCLHHADHGHHHCTCPHVDIVG